MKSFKLCFLLFPFWSFGQVNLDFKQGGEFAYTFCDTIPFEWQRNKIFIPVTINNQKRRFLFDTGATMIVSEEISKELGYEILAVVTQTDAVNNKVEVKTCRTKEILIGKTSFKDVPAIIQNTKEQAPLSCLNYDGFIGSNVLRNCIVQIDLPNKRLIITNDVNLLDLRNTSRVDIRTDNQSNPYVFLTTSKTKFEALFDSGSDALFSISKKIADKAVKQKMATVTNEGFGKTTISISNNEKTQIKQRVNFTSINIGDRAISDITIQASEMETENGIGSKILNYGIVTVDYKNKHFYFEPLVALVKTSNSTFGFSPSWDDKGYFVSLVWTNSIAEKMGLKVGNRILKINDLDLLKRDKETECSFFLGGQFDKEEMTLTFETEAKEVKTIKMKPE